MSKVPTDGLPWRFETGTSTDLLVVCDHASNRIPAELNGLGLGPDELARHIAWDPGAQGIAQALANRLQCPAFYGVWSRLLVDLNRAEDAADVIVAQSDGIRVPANADLTADERKLRIERYHRPYHAAIAEHVRQTEQAGIRVSLIAVHTFTPVLNHHVRPWHAGVVWKRRQPWHTKLLSRLAAMGEPIGDNLPYDGLTAMGYTLEHLGIAAERQHVMFEVRQDLVSSSAQQSAWAERLFDGLTDCGFLIDGAAASERSCESHHTS
ncbi:MAG: N-formylglutamate amidohydrolase [Pseudomarimonas sp.]